MSIMRLKITLTTLIMALFLIASNDVCYAQSNKSRTSSTRKVVSKTPVKTTAKKEVKKLPSNHLTVQHNKTYLHVNNGRYYKRVNSSYVLVTPPIGLRVISLPKTRILFRYNNRSYYSSQGVIYVDANNGEYEVVQPEVGMIVPELPEVNVSEVTIDGKIYFEFDGILYKQIPTEYGLQYEVIGTLNV